jgi:hypothetical protein
MSSSSSAKKVRKAARAGGSKGPKTSRERNLGFPLAIAIICILGTALVVVSKAENEDQAEARDEVTDEVDRFAATYGVFDCTEWVATSLPNPETSQDFVIPLSSENADRNGRLDRWADGVSVELSADALVVSSVDPPIERAVGDDCEGEEGAVFLTVWSTNDEQGVALDEVEVQTITDDPGAYRPRNGDRIAIVFAPEGTEIDEPPVPDGATESSETTLVADTSEAETG